MKYPYNYCYYHLSMARIICYSFLLLMILNQNSLADINPKEFKFNQNLVYFSDINGKKLISYDCGINWVEKIILFKVKSNIIYLFNKNGTFISYDNGYNWQIHLPESNSKLDYNLSLKRNKKFNIIEVYDIYGKLNFRETYNDDLNYDLILLNCREKIHCDVYYVKLLKDNDILIHQLYILK